MQLLHTLADLAMLNRPVHLAIGVFDGVHLGHQQVIGQARDNARAASGVSVVLTFDPHPARVLHPDQAPPLLTSTTHKLRLIEQLGADACLLLAFDRAFAATSAETFLEQVAAHAHPLREICVGSRFHFGHERAGNVRLMEKLAPRFGFVVREILSVLDDKGEMISSSAVRQHVLHGRLDRAAAMLGRPFSLLGTVVPGDHRGRSLGFPTANLNPHNGALPPDGVYAARVHLVGQASRLSPAPMDGRDACPTYTGVVNVGSRPTFAHPAPGRLIEVHLLDFDRDLYGQEIEVALVGKLRGEQKFPSAAALQHQIRADIAVARQILATHG